MNWNDITLKDYEELTNAYKTDKTRFANAAIEYLYGIKNAENTLTLTEYAKYLNEIKFFQTQPPKAKLKTSYTLNGTQYDVKLNMQELTAVQFQDYTIYSRQLNPSTIDLLSVVMIPHGKHYNEDYNIEQAKTDIGNMNVSDAFAVVFFFADWLRKYVNFLSDYLTKQTKKIKNLPTKTQEQIQTLTATLQQITNMA